MKKFGIDKIILLTFSMFCIGCAALTEDMMAYTHTAFLPIGVSRNEIQAKVENILGKYIQELKTDRNSDEELLAEEYRFTVDNNLIVYYYRGRLVQIGLHKPGNNEYPAYRADYKVVTKESPGEIAGYLLSYNGKIRSIETLYVGK